MLEGHDQFSGIGSDKYIALPTGEIGVKLNSLYIPASEIPNYGIRQIFIQAINALEEEVLFRFVFFVKTSKGYLYSLTQTYEDEEERLIREGIDLDALLDIRCKIGEPLVLRFKEQNEARTKKGIMVKEIFVTFNPLIHPGRKDISPPQFVGKFKKKWFQAPPNIAVDPFDDPSFSEVKINSYN